MGFMVLGEFTIWREIHVAINEAVKITDGIYMNFMFLHV